MRNRSVLVLLLTLPLIFAGCANVLNEMYTTWLAEDWETLLMLLDQEEQRLVNEQPRDFEAYQQVVNLFRSYASLKLVISQTEQSVSESDLSKIYDYTQDFAAHQVTVLQGPLAEQLVSLGYDPKAVTRNLLAEVIACREKAATSQLEADVGEEVDKLTAAVATVYEPVDYAFLHDPEIVRQVEQLHDSMVAGLDDAVVEAVRAFFDPRLQTIKEHTGSITSRVESVSILDIDQLGQDELSKLTGDVRALIVAIEQASIDAGALKDEVYSEAVGATLVAVERELSQVADTAALKLFVTIGQAQNEVSQSEERQAASVQRFLSVVASGEYYDRLTKIRQAIGYRDKSLADTQTSALNIQALRADIDSPLLSAYQESLGRIVHELEGMNIFSILKSHAADTPRKNEQIVTWFSGYTSYPMREKIMGLNSVQDLLLSSVDGDTLSFRFKLNGIAKEVRFQGRQIVEAIPVVYFLNYFFFLLMDRELGDLDALPGWISQRGSMREISNLLLQLDDYQGRPAVLIGEIRSALPEVFAHEVAQELTRRYLEADTEKEAALLLRLAFDVERSAPFAALLPTIEAGGDPYLDLFRLQQDDRVYAYHYLGINYATIQKKGYAEDFLFKSLEWRNPNIGELVLALEQNESIGGVGELSADFLYRNLSPFVCASAVNLRCAETLYAHFVEKQDRAYLEKASAHLYLGETERQLAEDLGLRLPSESRLRLLDVKIPESGDFYAARAGLEAELGLYADARQILSSVVDGKQRFKDLLAEIDFVQAQQSLLEDQYFHVNRGLAPSSEWLAEEYRLKRTKDVEYLVQNHTEFLALRSRLTLGLTDEIPRGSVVVESLKRDRLQLPYIEFLRPLVEQGAIVVASSPESASIADILRSGDNYQKRLACLKSIQLKVKARTASLERELKELQRQFYTESNPQTIYALALGHYFNKDYDECLELLRLFEKRGLVDIPALFLKARVLSEINDPGYRIIFDAILNSYLKQDIAQSWRSLPWNEYREAAIRSYIEG